MRLKNRLLAIWALLHPSHAFILIELTKPNMANLISNEHFGTDEEIDYVIHYVRMRKFNYLTVIKNLDSMIEQDDYILEKAKFEAEASLFVKR
jgi:hypothetical protein